MARGGGGRAAPARGGGVYPGEAGTRKRGSLAPSLPASRAKEQPGRSKDGDKFWRMPECYIRGSTIKYLRIPDEIIDMVKEEVVSKGRGRGGMQQQKQQKGRGVGGAGRACQIQKYSSLCSASLGAAGALRASRGLQGVFGGRGRGIPGSGRGQQEKKPGRQSAKQ
ncbi:U6 snRNA-associated Sm-like protein LSm4 isoform X2 [Ciconia boyciana]|uniref:U6 snRNA-associated Sm-like protein LSm4 isoform X2 n=1 Tax=Ciconia boyciana TaxID=52775 RepID=UPI003BA369EE